MGWVNKTPFIKNGGDSKKYSCYETELLQDFYFQAFDPLAPGATKTSHILRQNWSWELQV